MLTNGARVAVVVVVEFIALVIAAYACFVAFILLPLASGEGLRTHRHWQLRVSAPFWYPS